TQLKEAIRKHLAETEGQVERLEKIGTIVDTSMTGKTCKAMKGLIDETKEAMDEESENPALVDALLIGAAQRVEHYEIAAYGTARAMAETLGLNEVAELLQETLDEEAAADKKLTEIAEGEVLPQSVGGANDEESEDDSRGGRGAHM